MDFDVILLVIALFALYAFTVIVDGNTVAHKQDLINKQQRTICIQQAHLEHKSFAVC